MASNFVRVGWSLGLVIVAVNGFAGTPLAPPLAGDSVAVLGGEDCADGVVKDDGTLETGYGWVPSVVDGRYVQRFEVGEFQSRKMEEICVCWTRTRTDDSITFNVDLYRDRGGRPALSPDASLEAVATLVPTYPDGAFFSVDVSQFDFHAQTGVFYLGVRWDASEDQYFFVCADKSEETPVVEGWYTDDRASGWGSVIDTSDPTFFGHRAMMIRAVALEGYFPMVPTLDTWGLLILIGAICAVGLIALRRGQPRDR